MIFQYMDKDLKKKKTLYVVTSWILEKFLKISICTTINSIFVYTKKKKKLYIKTVRNYPLIFIGYAVIKISFSFGKFSS